MTDECEDFRPFMTPYCYVTNDKYDPDGFSEELENSEEDMLDEEMKEIMSHPGISVNKKFNSPEWKENHLKICKLKVDIPAVLMTAYEDKDLAIRHFGGPDNIEKIAEWFMALKANNQHVYMFALI